MKKVFKKIKDLLPLLLIIVGIVLLIIPFISQMFVQNKNDSIIENYKKKYEYMSYEEINEIKKSAEEYNEYKTDKIETINSEDAISYIDIPKINVHLPIFMGTKNDIIEKGVGLLEKTSFPIGGLGTHSVLTAHSGIPHQTLFNNLKDLEVGDLFYINTFNEELVYEVKDTVVCLPDEYSKYIVFDKNHDRCTLITCTPTPTNTHRLLVFGERYSEEKSSTKDEVSSVDNENNYKENNVYYIIIFTTFVVVICLIKRRVSVGKRK